MYLCINFILLKNDHSCMPLKLIHINAPFYPTVYRVNSKYVQAVSVMTTVLYCILHKTNYCTILTPSVF
jgi:hypothetical protein